MYCSFLAHLCRRHFVRGVFVASDRMQRIPPSDTHAFGGYQALCDSASVLPQSLSTLRTMLRPSTLQHGGSWRFHITDVLQRRKGCVRSTFRHQQLHTSCHKHVHTLCPDQNFELVTTQACGGVNGTVLPSTVSLRYCNRDELVCGRPANTGLSGRFTDGYCNQAIISLASFA